MIERQPLHGEDPERGIADAAPGDQQIFGGNDDLALRDQKPAPFRAVPDPDIAVPDRFRDCHGHVVGRNADAIDHIQIAHCARPIPALLQAGHHPSTGPGPDTLQISQYGHKINSRVPGVAVEFSTKVFRSSFQAGFPENFSRSGAISMAKSWPDNRLGGFRECDDELLNDIGQFGNRNRHAGGDDHVAVAPRNQRDADHALDYLHFGDSVKKNLGGIERVNHIHHLSPAVPS